MTRLEELQTWFDGEIYVEGAEVVNPISGGAISLDNYALSIYDFIMGTEALVHALRTQGTPTEIIGNVLELHGTAMSWFRKHYPEEYMVLLD
jgi:hypothetical protein